MSGGGKSSQQMNTNNQVAAQQLAMQQKQLAQYNDYVNKLIQGGGYLPGVKSALTSQAIQGVPQQYDQISKNLETQLASRGAAGGGSLPGSGLYGRGLGQLYSSEEQNKSGLLNQITAGGQANIAAGEGGILNAAGLNSSVGSSALGGATTAAGNADANAGGLFGSIIGGGLGVLGSSLGAGGILNKGKG